MKSRTIPPSELQSRFRSEGLWTNQTLPFELVRWGTKTPDNLAIVDEVAGRQVNYRELLSDVVRIASWLVSVGVGPDRTVSVQLPNRYETAVIMLAVLTAGGRLNPLLPNYRRRELEYILSTANSTVLFTPGFYRDFDHGSLGLELMGTIESVEHHIVVGDDSPHESLTYGAVLANAPDRGEFPPINPRAVSEVIFTSGTESNPKAVMHSEETLNHSVRATIEHLGLDREDTVYMPSPLGHSTGLNFGLRLAVIAGLPLVLQDRWKPERAVELIQRYRCSYTLAATTFLADILRVAPEQADLSSMRMFGCGGAPVPPELVRMAQSRGISVRRLYGSTEGLILSWNPPHATDEQLTNTDGCIMTSTEVIAVNEAGCEVPNGTEGELLIRGPNVCIGFHNDPDREQEAFTDDGWLHTGDVGIVRDDKHLNIVGRKKEIIIRGGLNIAPREIEDVIAQIPGIADFCVIGVPDERLGEIVCVCLVGASDDPTLPSLEDIVRYLRSNGMANYKLPQRLVHVDELPRTPTGKIQKTVLWSSVIKLRERQP